MRVHTIYDVADSLQATAANWPFVVVKFGGFLVNVKQKNVGANIEYRVHTSCKNGEGARGYGCVH